MAVRHRHGASTRAKASTAGAMRKEDRLRMVALLGVFIVCALVVVIVSTIAAKDGVEGLLASGGLRERKRDGFEYDTINSDRGATPRFSLDLKTTQDVNATE
eukprot:TRINITY_DN23517_c0_g1_i1.p2 TRINITY_DN23517_c0_g1~~TRINITY_DN23517_c0_g1_i1.p2  ORF type:complete len:120 (+),score=18.79 TRINITY_DN23517_c0_g1_i1:57-362(+)